MTPARYRLVAGLIALAAATGLVATEVPANALSIDDPLILQSCANVTPNLVTNCGFEAPATSNTAPGWTHVVAVNSGVTAISAYVHSGSHSLVFSSTSSDDVWIQTITVQPHTAYLIGLQATANSDGNPAQDDMTFTASNTVGGTSSGGVTTIFSSRNTNFGWLRQATAVTSGASRTMTLTLAGANVPGYNAMDDVYVTPQRSGCASIANDLVRNCGFEASPTSAAPWVHAVSHDSSVIRPNSYGGLGSLEFGSTVGDDVWYQTLPVRPHTPYTLSYWVEYWSGTHTPANDLTVSVSNVPSAGGTLKIATKNVANRFWSEVTRTFTTGSGTSLRVTLAGQNIPVDTWVDDVSVTPIPHVAIRASGAVVTTTLTGLGGQPVQLQRLVGTRWVAFRTFLAPTTGWAKAWAVTVPSGRYRAVAESAPGYAPATSATVQAS